MNTTNGILLLKLTIIPEIIEMGLLDKTIDQYLNVLYLKHPELNNTNVNDIQYEIADSTNGEKIVTYFVLP